MADFEVVGWALPTLSAASQKALALLKRLALETKAFCVEAYFRDLGAVTHLAQAMPSDRFACYCWNKIRDGGELRSTEFEAMGRARLVFGRHEVSVYDDRDLPWYDWDGRPSGFAIVSVAIWHPPPVDTQDREPSSAMIQLCTEIGRKVAASEPEPIKTSTSFENQGRKHTYLMKVPKVKAGLAASEICSRLALCDGYGSYEFLGPPAFLESIQRSGRFLFEGFPTHCWSQNAQVGTPFALARQAFLSPVPNVTCERLPAAAAVLDCLGDRVADCGVIADYLAWKLAMGRVSPRTGGNYILISRRKAGYTISVGFEQFADEDPSVREFTAYARPVVEEMSAQLKRLAAPR